MIRSLPSLGERALRHVALQAVRASLGKKISQTDLSSHTQKVSPVASSRALDLLRAPLLRAS